MPEDVGGETGLPLMVTLPYLAAWRAWAGFSRAQLAKRAAVSEYTLRNAEAGKRVKLDVAWDIARALGLTVRQLVELDPTRLRNGELPPRPQ